MSPVVDAQRYDEAIRQRDSARDAAVALEAEVALLVQILREAGIDYAPVV